MRVIFTILMLGMAVSLAGQDTLRFHKLGSSDKEKGVKILEDSDSSYLVLVNSGDAAFESNSSIQVLRINDADSIISSVSISSSGTESANDFVITEESSIIVCGITNGLTTHYSGFLFILDVEKNLKEIYHDLGEEWSEFSNVIAVQDSIIAILELAIEGEALPRFEGFDLQGVELFAKEIVGFEGHKFKDFKRSIWGNGYISCGFNQNDSMNGFIARFDNTLDLEWKHELALSGEDSYNAIEELSDSSIIVIGHSDGFFKSDIDIVVQKFTPFGAPIDTIIQGYDINANNQEDIPFGLTIFHDTIYFTGVTYTYGQGGAEPFMTVLNKDLGLLPFSTTFGTDRDDFSYSIVKNNRMLKGVGYTVKETNGLDDIIIWTRSEFNPGQIKIEFELSAFSIQDTIVGISEMRSLDSNSNTYWYSTHNDLNVVFSSDQIRNIHVIDALGRTIDEITANNRLVNIAYLPTGFYILSVSTLDKRTTHKVWVN
jgi:hypothetical protein